MIDEQGQFDWMAAGAFLLIGMLGTLLDWSAADMVHGFLLTSFFTCILAFLLGIQSMIRLWLPKLSEFEIKNPVFGLLALLVLLFMICILLLIIGGSVLIGHVLYLFSIYSLFPLLPGTADPFALSSEEQFRMIAVLFKDYWLFALFTIAGEWKSQLRPLWKPQNLDIIQPAIRLGRMHLFVLIAIATATLIGTGMLFYWLILLFFFIPWGRLKKLFSARIRSSSR